MLGGKVVEGEQRFPVLDEAGHGPRRLGAASVDEMIEGALARVSGVSTAERKCIAGAGRHLERPLTVATHS
jgi:hypothetical protein